MPMDLFTDLSAAASVFMLSLIHIYYGTIEPGKKADLVLWDRKLQLKKVIKDGITLL